MTTNTRPEARPVRRVVTTHDTQGRAVVSMDGAAPNAKLRQAAGGLISTLIWATDETPADIDAGTDRAARDMGVPPPDCGTVFRVVDFPPMGDAAGVDHGAVLKEMGIAPAAAGQPARSPFMHRTRSIDYAMVLSGEIVMVMDDSEVVLRAGDTLVQQGTNHAWENRGKDWCRVAFVLVDAKKPSAWKGDAGH